MYYMIYFLQEFEILKYEICLFCLKSSFIKSLSNTAIPVQTVTG